MRLKLERFEELASGNGHAYIFAGTLGRTNSFCLEQSSKRGNRDDLGNLIEYDITEFVKDLALGKMPISLITSYLQHTLVMVDGKEEFDHELEVKIFIEDMGLEDSANFCALLLHHALVGMVKKKAENRSLKMKVTLGLILMNSKKPGLRLAAILLIGAIFLCTVFSSDILYIVRLMV